MAHLPRWLFRGAYWLDAQVGSAVRSARRSVGLARPLRILPYRGFGTPERVLVSGRILEDKGVPPPTEWRSLLGSAVASYRRYATLEMPQTPFRIQWGESAWEGRTDDEGFIAHWIEPPSGVAPGWHSVTIDVAGAGRGAHPTVRAPVLVVSPDAQFCIVSDIDDTVIVTGAAYVHRRAFTLFLTDRADRKPFDGVSAFYQALCQGQGNAARNPVFYVSSSPWNLYEHLDTLLGQHALPAGPIMLRDWGLTREGFAPGGGHRHKVDKIQTILDSFPDLPFVLLGDSGQEDPMHYRTLVEDNPGRILAVYIRSVPTRARRFARLPAIAEAVRERGVDFVVATSTEELARHAERKGLLVWGGRHAGSSTSVR